MQALVTLNDPGFIEAAKVLGETMTKENDAPKAIADTYRKLTGRLPAAKEMELLLSVQKAALGFYFSGHPFTFFEKRVRPFIKTQIQRLLCVLHTVIVA